MNKVQSVFIFLLLLLTLSCTKELETTGRVIVSIINQNLNNQEDYFVQAGIVFRESDDDVLIDFGKRDISEGGSIEFDPRELNVGNYYIRYQYFLGNSLSGGERHKPFQIQAGEETVVSIIR